MRTLFVPQAAQGVHTAYGQWAQPVRPVAVHLWARAESAEATAWAPPASVSSSDLFQGPRPAVPMHQLGKAKKPKALGG